MGRYKFAARTPGRFAGRRGPAAQHARCWIVSWTCLRFDLIMTLMLCSGQTLASATSLILSRLERPRRVKRHAGYRRIDLSCAASSWLPYAPSACLNYTAPQVMEVIERVMRENHPFDSTQAGGRSSAALMQGEPYGGTRRVSRSSATGTTSSRRFSSAIPRRARTGARRMPAGRRGCCEERSGSTCGWEMLTRFAVSGSVRCCWQRLPTHTFR